MSTSKSMPVKHEWLVCMERFARNIRPFWEDMLERSKEAVGESQGKGANLAAKAIKDDVVVALIDDGVMAVHEFLAGRVLMGKTFDYHGGNNVGQPYASAQGHGTEMAKLILRVCPMAKIYPIRLKTNTSKDGKCTFDLESAALAIQAARAQNASIILMPWSIQPVLGDKNQKAEKLFVKAITQASEEKRLIFCSSADNGNFRKYGYPGIVEHINLFRIGAACYNARPYDWTDGGVKYIFPGVQVNKFVQGDGRGEQGEITGSGVATALAAGMAATIIYCFKTCALATKIAWAQADPRGAMPSTQFNEKHVRSITEHLNMEFAFANIGYINDHRFIQVWDLFGPVNRALENPRKTHQEKLECIITACNILNNWRAGL